MKRSACVMKVTVVMSCDSAVPTLRKVGHTHARVAFQHPNLWDVATKLSWI